MRPDIPILSQSGRTYADTLRSFPGLVSYWRMDDGDGPIMRDELGKNDLNVTGGLARGRPGALVGDGNRSAYYDGNNVNTAGKAVPAIPSGASPRTVIGWINTSAAITVQQSMIVYGNSGTRNAFGLKLHEGGANNAGLFTYADDLFTAIPPNDGRWHMLAATYNGATALITYWDGRQLGTRTLGAPLTTPLTQPLYLGRDIFGASCVLGLLDECSIGSAALTAGQIAQLWAIGSGR